VVDVLAAKALKALEQTGLKTLVVAGGVGANQQLRERLVEETGNRGASVHFPPLELCTDNGAMIALAGLAKLRRSAKSGGTGFAVQPRWSLADATS
jgi:N6-L-threonylcarbamoyladenine synthase